MSLSTLMVLGALTAAPLSAGVESLKIEPTVMPGLSPTMQMDGVTKGTIIVAISVSAEGQLTDYLVVAHTHQGLVSPCIAALKEWKFTPARIDGQPVAAQAELKIEFSAEGVVISQDARMNTEAFLSSLFGQRFIKRLPRPGELDKAPTRVATVAPLYATEAEKQGVKGTVRVHYYIDENGAVRMPSVEPGANPYLANSAVAAVRDWKFEPPTQRGRPVLVSVKQDFEFGH